MMYETGLQRKSFGRGHFKKNSISCKTLGWKEANTREMHVYHRLGSAGNAGHTVACAPRGGLHSCPSLTPLSFCLSPPPLLLPLPPPLSSCLSPPSSLFSFFPLTYPLLSTPFVVGTQSKNLQIEGGENLRTVAVSGICTDISLLTYDCVTVDIWYG